MTRISIGGADRGAILAVVDVGADPVARIAEVLRSLRGEQDWVCYSDFRRARREMDDWISSIAIGVDLDMPHIPGSEPTQKYPLPEDARQAIEDAARDGDVPGSIVYCTPRGTRSVFVFDVPIRDRRTYYDVWRGCTARVSAWLATAAVRRVGLTVDRAPKDPSRFWWGARGRPIVAISRAPFTVEDLAAQLTLRSYVTRARKTQAGGGR